MTREYSSRLSGTCRVVENAFGIMANRFDCLLTTMNQNKDAVTSVGLASCALHNIMRIQYPGVHQGIGDDEDDNHRLVPGQRRQGVNLQDIGEITAGNKDT